MNLKLLKARIQANRIFRQKLNSDRALYQNPLVALIAAIVSSIIDCGMLYSMIDSIIYESQVVVLLSTASTCFFMDFLFPVISSHLFLIPDPNKLTKTMNMLLITAFVIISTFIVILRIQYSDALIGTSEALLQTSQSEVTVTDRSIMPAIFLAIVPVLTSIAVFILSYISNDPKRKNKILEKAMYSQKSLVNRLNEVIATATLRNEREAELRDAVILQTAATKKKKIQAQTVVSLAKFRQLLAMRIKASPVDLTKITNDAQKIYERSVEKND